MFSLSLVEHTLRLPPHLLSLSLEKAVRHELEELFLDKVGFLFHSSFFPLCFICLFSCTLSHGLWDWLTWQIFVLRWSQSWGFVCLFTTSGASLVVWSFQGMAHRRTRYLIHANLLFIHMISSDLWLKFDPTFVAFCRIQYRFFLYANELFQFWLV